MERSITGGPVAHRLCPSHEQKLRVPEPDFAQLVTNVVASGASDLHLSIGAPPVMRLNGDLIALGREPLTAQQTRELVYGLLTNDQRQRLENDLEIDLSYAIPGRVRFRVNWMRPMSLIGSSCVRAGSPASSSARVSYTSCR